MVPDPVAEIKRDKGPTFQEGQRNVLRAVRAVADVVAAGKISSKVADEYSASGGDRGEGRVVRCRTTGPTGDAPT